MNLKCLSDSTSISATRGAGELSSGSRGALQQQQRQQIEFLGAKHLRNGICPKCGHATVHSGRDIPVKGSSGNMIPIDFQHHVALDNYVCVSCGYVESYISDKAALERIEKQWPEANKTKRKR